MIPLEMLKWDNLVTPVLFTWPMKCLKREISGSSGSFGRRISFDKATFFWFSKLLEYPWPLLVVERLQMLPGTEPCIDRALNLSSQVCVLPFLWVKKVSVGQENSRRQQQRGRKLQQQSQEGSPQQRIGFLWPPCMGNSALPAPALVWVMLSSSRWKTTGIFNLH